PTIHGCLTPFKAPHILHHTSGTRVHSDYIFCNRFVAFQPSATPHRVGARAGVSELRRPKSLACSAPMVRRVGREDANNYGFQTRMSIEKPSASEYPLRVEHR